ncbi:MAG: XylR N-terminal domain-containing protein [Candidatus Thorarchaeota archaeon]
MHGLIEAIEAKYEEIFKTKLEFKPEESRIKLVGENVMFIGLRAIAIDLKDELDSVLGEAGRNLLIYRLGQSFGRSEAERILPQLGLDELPARIAAGPIWAAYSGFVRVRLLPGSVLEPNENYFLFYEHPNNFEAELWKKEGRTATEPLCYFNVGYSSGWCSVASGLELEAEEILCEAKGDQACRFIMFPASRRMEYMERLDEFRSK